MRFSISLLWMVLALGSASVLADDRMTQDLQAFVVLTDDNGRETLKRTNKICRGDILEYRVTYTNTTGRALESLVLQWPVPEGMQFLPDSAKSNAGHVFEVSDDGGRSWQEAPRIVVGMDGQRYAVGNSPEQLDALRWVANQPLAAMDRLVYRYRVEVISDDA